MDESPVPEFIIGPGHHIYEMPGPETSIPRVIQPSVEVSQYMACGDQDEDEDPEVAFYRELRQQEEERRWRLSKTNN